MAKCFIIVLGFHPGLLSAQYALQKNWFPDPIQVKSVHVCQLELLENQKNKNYVKINLLHNQDHPHNWLASQYKLSNFECNQLQESILVDKEQSCGS